MTTPKDVMKMIKENDIKIIDVKLTDLFGQWHHLSMPVEAFSTELAFEEGIGFDGSSIRGFQSIEAEIRAIPHLVGVEMHRDGVGAGGDVLLGQGVFIGHQAVVARTLGRHCRAGRYDFARRPNTRGA